MRIRVKFAKRGSMKFIGHLDVMRYFQKVIRRAKVDITMTSGFSPHQIMSFAAPLGLGLTSEGEYMDIEVNSTESSKEMIKRLNAVMVDGMEVLSYGLIPEGTPKAMASVGGADYLVHFCEERLPDAIKDAAVRKQLLSEFFERTEIVILKKTKKSEIETDIRPMILDWKFEEKELFLKLETGSEKNLKPELVCQSFYESLGLTWNPFDIQVKRLEMYAKIVNDNNVMLTPMYEQASEIMEHMENE